MLLLYNTASIICSRSIQVEMGTAKTNATQVFEGWASSYWYSRNQSATPYR